jgi:hypothetical protein
MAGSARRGHERPKAERETHRSRPQPVPFERIRPACSGPHTALRDVQGQEYCVAVDPTGKFVYFADNGLTAGVPTNPSISAFTLSGTGGLVPVGGSPFAMSGSVPWGIAADPTGKFLYMSGYYSSGISNSLYAETITEGTGALAGVSGSPFLLGVSNPGIAIAAFPAP